MLEVVASEVSDFVLNTVLRTKSETGGGPWKDQGVWADSRVFFRKSFRSMVKVVDDWAATTPAPVETLL